MNSIELKRQKAYEIFQAKCAKMIESKFLLAQPCIAGVLKCIIASPELYQFIKDCISNIDCEDELSKATLNSGKQEFILPESKRVMVALVTYLLNQFDNNEIDLMEFIAYYYNPDTNIGYQIFCREVVEPYCRLVGEVFLNDNIVDEVSEPQVQDINYAVYEQADMLIKDIVTEIQSSNSVREDERADMITLAEGMMVALSNLDAKIIIALFIGMKYAYGKHRKINKALKELEKLFIKYAIVQ